MIRSTRRVALAALLSGCVRPGADASAHAAGDVVVGDAGFALTGVGVVDGTGAAIRHDMTIVVRGSRIVAVGPRASTPIPSGARAIALPGRYVIPGLIDAHVHLATFDRGEIMPVLLRSTLMGGVTSVRDMGGRVTEVAALARRGAAGDTTMPRIHFATVAAGPHWFATYDPVRVAYWSAGTSPGTGAGLRLLDSPAAVPAIVAEARAMGASGIKVYTGVDAASLRALVAAAHAVGLRVWAHAVAAPSTPQDVVDAGSDVTSHADMPIHASAAPSDSVGTATTRSRLMAAGVTSRSPAIAALLRAMRARGTMHDPTLLVMAMAAATDEGPNRSTTIDSIVAWATAFTREAHRAGVPIVAGTDAIGRETPNIHSELQLLVDRAGLTPLEAIRSATQHAARAIGADSLGVIAPGMVADVVILRGDPAADVRNTQTVETVVRGGIMLRRTQPWQAPALARSPERR